MGEDFGGVGVGFDFGHDFFDDAFFADDESRPDNAHGDFSVEFLFLPDAVGVDGLKFGIGKENERQGVFFGEFAVTFNGVFADADDDDIAFFKFLKESGKGARLTGAAGSVVFGVEVENYFLSREVGGRNHISVLIRQRKNGGDVSDLHKSSFKKVLLIDKSVGQLDFFSAANLNFKLDIVSAAEIAQDLQFIILQVI